MDKDKERKKVVRSLKDIAFGRSNDAVKLVFLSDENASELLGGLDLTMLSEVKKGPNGTVEIKLINRLEALKLLLDELSPEEAETDGTGLIAAISAAAGNTGTRSDNPAY